MAEQTQRDGIYLRLARELRAAILRQDFPEGVRLPTEAELADRFGISRQTVRRAFQDLVAEGLVHRVPGRGTFATPREEQYLRQFGSVDDLMGLAIDTRMQVVTPLHPRVDVDAAGRLGLHSDRVHKVAFLRLHEDTAFCHTSVFLPPEVGGCWSRSRNWPSPAPPEPPPSSVCSTSGCPSRSPRPSRASRSRRPTPGSPDTSGANRAVRCCASTGSTSPRPDGSWSWPSVTSCPSTTRIAYGCGAADADASPPARIRRRP